MTAGDFFAGHKQKDIRIRRYKGKSPLFYRDVSFMGAIFTADLDALIGLLPDRRFQPIQALPGIGLVAIHCVEYRDSDIGPYNEVALSIAIRRGRRLLPVPTQLSALRSFLTQSFHAHIRQLPVTTDVALYGGLDYFNYPKYVADISFRETKLHRICTLRDKKSMDLILEFDGVKIRTSDSPRKMLFNTYPQKDGRTLHAKMAVNLLTRGEAFVGKCASFRLGRHPRAVPFRELKLGRPVHYLYAPAAEAILFMPETLR